MIDFLAAGNTKIYDLHVGRSCGEGIYAWGELRDTTTTLTYDEMFRQLNTAIHRFAKRQMTYFRGMERRGVPITWLPGEASPEKNVERIVDLFSGRG